MLTGRLAWQRRTMPVSQSFLRELSHERYPGRRIAYWAHLTANSTPVFEWLAGTGAEVLIGSSDASTADPDVVQYIRELGVTVLEGLDKAVAWRPELVCENGGELTEALIRAGTPPKAVVEGTANGIHRLEALQPLAMPVLNWNDIPLKQNVEHRFHVADGVWNAISMLTGLSVQGRHVLVIGHGNVGKGIADKARRLGARTTVAEPDPLRALDARMHGHAVVGDASTAAHTAEIVVTATGRRDAMPGAALMRLPRGAVVANAGHAKEEINGAYLGHLTRRSLKPGVDEYVRPDGREFYVLADASLVNLAAANTTFGDDIWDLFAAVSLLGCRWLLDQSRTAPPGLHPFPEELQRRVASVALAPAQEKAVVIPHEVAGELRELVGPHCGASVQSHSLAESNLDAGCGVAEHYHLTIEETYYILAGSGVVRLDGTDHPVSQGDVVAIPAGVRHSVTAEGDGLRLLAISVPPWHVADHHMV